MRIAYDNFIDDGVVTSSGADALFPVVNLQDQRLSKPFEYSGSSVSIYIDLGSAKVVNTVAVLGHSLSASAVVTFSAYDVSYLDAPIINEICTWSAEAILKFFLYTLSSSCIGSEVPDELSSEDSYLLIEEESASFRYWKVTITDSGASKISVGRVWIGTYLTISPSALLDFSIVLKTSDRVYHGSDRQKFGIPGVSWRQFNLAFPETDYTMISAIETMIDAVGMHSSLIFCNFDTIRSYNIVEPCYCSLSEEVGFIHSSRMRFKYGIVLEEDK